MSLINQVGTYRGVVVDKAVTVSTNGYPQLQVVLGATEIYDDELKDWYDRSEVEENEITAYLVLFDGKNRQTLNFNQVEKIFDWNGALFAELEALDHSETRIQFRVVERTYQGKTNLQVEWIDEYDATPGRTVRKLDATELKDLDAAYASLMNKPKVKPASAKAAKAPPTVSQAQAAKVEEEMQARANQEPPVAEKKKKIEPPKVPARKKPKITGTTKQEAWDACVELKAKTVTDALLSQAWVDTIEKIAPGKADADITPEEWGQIQELVLYKTAKF